MIHCWPSEISAMDVNFETTDSIHEFTVTLQYTYWTAKGVASGVYPTDGDVNGLGNKFTST